MIDDDDETSCCSITKNTFFQADTTLHLYPFHFIDIRAGITYPYRSTVDEQSRY